MADVIIDGLDLRLSIVTYRSKQIGTFTSVAHALNLAAEGQTAEEAEQKLVEMLQRFLNDLAESGRLAEVLRQLPDEDVPEDVD